MEFSNSPVSALEQAWREATMKHALIALLALRGADKDKPAPKQTLCPLIVDTEIDEEEFIIYRGVKEFGFEGVWESCFSSWAWEQRRSMMLRRIKSLLLQEEALAGQCFLSFSAY